MVKINSIIIEEVKRFNNMAYFSKPYSCCIDECLTYFKGWDVDETKITITRKEKETLISIPPKKGARARKKYEINIWMP